ncbi:hypothetical protein [Methylobacterium sp. JK268]
MKDSPLSAAQDMEPSFLRIAALAQMLVCCGTPSTVPPPEAVATVGAVIAETADALREEWRALVAQLGGLP